MSVPQCWLLSLLYGFVKNCEVGRVAIKHLETLGAGVFLRVVLLRAESASHEGDSRLVLLGQFRQFLFGSVLDSARRQLVVPRLGLGADGVLVEEQRVRVKRVVVGVPLRLDVCNFADLQREVALVLLRDVRVHFSIRHQQA